MEAPIEPPVDPTASPRGRIRLPRFRIWLSRWAILWERFWPAFWPTFVVGGLFLAAALFDLLPLLPGWLHLLLLIGFAAAFAYALGRIWPALRFPGFMEGLRRIERVNELRHRPLTGLADGLATSAGDPAASRLWEQYRRQIGRGIGRLRVGLPQAGFMQRDPFALRVLLGLVLLVAIVGGWRDAPERLLRALTPNLSSLAATGPVSLTLSLTPPTYTNLAPIFLEVGDGAGAGAADTANALKLPIGTNVLALFQGSSAAPDLMLGTTATPFTAVEPETYQAKAEIRGGDRLAVVSQGRDVAAWPLTVIPDNPPTIGFTAPPGAAERKTLRIAYAATDDYGIASVTGTIRRADGQSGPGKIDRIELSLSLPATDARQAQQVSYHDLTPHPWAGLPVTIQLTAKDAIGQSASSDTLEIVLPERTFRHPVARAVIEQRKRLIMNPDDRRSVARALYAIGSQPPTYNDDLVVVLGLQVAQRRLTMIDGVEDAVDSVQMLLWELALRIEEGELSVAERELRRLQQELQEALANNAPDEEIERLMNELQEAMDEFMAALTEKLKRDMEQQGGRPHQRQFDPNMMEVHREDLQKLLDRARELAKGGARDAARDLLAQLQEMLENLQAMPFEQQTDPAMAEALQMLDDMDSLAKRQQELLDQSFRHSQQLGEGERMPNGDPGAADQEALRRQLGDLMRRYGEMMGDIPRSLGRAERSMRDATEALEQGAPGQAIEPQTQALGELQKGLQDMANAMMEQLQQQAGNRPGQDPTNQGRDPLGRDENGMGAIDTRDVEIPDQSDVQRARALIEELRKRAGDRARPKVERDYIDRLLKRF
jgi:uncharacterized protein (TIGR02302 family)